jgi:hypothetical protein
MAILLIQKRALATGKRSPTVHLKLIFNPYALLETIPKIGFRRF